MSLKDTDEVDIAPVAKLFESTIELDEETLFDLLFDMELEEYINAYDGPRPFPEDPRK